MPVTQRLDSEPLTVALVVTAPSALGSMRAYADLVEEALTSSSLPRPVRVVRVDLALPARLLARVPAQLGPWANIVHASWAARRLRSVHADVFHVLDGSSAHVVRACGGRPTVVTVHDVIPHLRLAGWFGGRRGSLPGRALLRRITDGLRAADRLVAVSACTARDLARAVSVPASRIDVVPVALLPKARRLLCRPPIAWPVRRREGPYVLHVGHNGFYKNRSGVVRVFARVAERADVHLVLAGPRPTRALRALVEALDVPERVTFVEEPSDEALETLYWGASLLLFPSLYEGFGLPVLEAMAAGCPVVCSTGGALPEVAGEAALMAPPDDAAALAAAALRVLDTPREADRLIALGRERAATYTLDAMAAGLLSAYERAIAEAQCRARAS